MKTHTGTILGVLGTIAMILAGIPEARAQEAPSPLARRAPASAVRGADEAARRLHAWLEQEIQASAKRRSLASPYQLRYGVEPELPAQTELRREIFFFLASLTGESSLRRAATSAPSSLTIRAVVDGEAEDRERRRATFVEIEELKGPSPRPTSAGARGAFASAGALLFASGIAGARLVSTTTTLVVPQPWPAGLRISGTFELP
jgi:hypothetical protein